MSKDNEIPKEKQKEKYKVVNWSAYNKSLKERGKISIWLPNNLSELWYRSTEDTVVGKQKYSDVAIEFCMIIKQLYCLPYRQTEGFIEDIFRQINLNLNVVSYTQIQRRQSDLAVNIRCEEHFKRVNIDVVIDSTGLMVYGEGEWKVRQHGKSKNRQWIKMSLASQPDTLEIVSQVITFNDVDDAETGVEIISQIKENIKSCAGDGAYDKAKFRACLSPQTKQLIPPQENATLSNNDPIMFQRDEAIKVITEIDRATWKKSVNYHIRSKAEVNMFRYKIIFGDHIKSRKLVNQKNEVSINCKILNKFAQLGLPESQKTIT